MNKHLAVILRFAFKIMRITVGEQEDQMRCGFSFNTTLEAAEAQGSIVLFEIASVFSQHKEQL